MLKTQLFSLSLLTTILLIGFDASAQSIEWYKTHVKERNAKVEECKKTSDPRGNEDCRNAIDASLHSGSFTKSPNKSW